MDTDQIANFIADARHSFAPIHSDPGFYAAKRYLRRKIPGAMIQILKSGVTVVTKGTVHRVPA